MLRFEYIELLYMLFGIPFIILIIWLNIRWRKRALAAFGEKKVLSKLMLSYSKNRQILKNILTVLIFISLIIGLSNPQIGIKMEEVKREGVDLMIAIDLSNSMLVEDIKPNRIERAKQAISRLIDKLEGDRIGLVVFAGEAYVQLPITTDYSAAKLFLSSLNTNIVPTQGTSIGSAINTCRKSFDMDNSQNKAIIIITDGETHDEEAIDAAKKAKEEGVFVHTLGMGLTQGGAIPIYNKYGNNIGFRKNKDGETIVSQLNESLLRQIAQAGNGTYIRANNSQAGLSTLFNEINKMEKKEIGTMIFTQYKDRFQFFIVFALVLLFLDFFLLDRRNRWSKTIKQIK